MVCFKIQSDRTYLDFSFSLNRIPAAAAHVSTMEPAKLDLPLKDFVVSVALDSQERNVIKVNKNNCINNKINDLTKSYKFSVVQNIVFFSI